jgi:hypothetical protein
MINNLFKGAFLIIGIFAVVILFGIYKRLDTGRFQMVAFPNSPASILDTKTGQVYTYLKTGYYFYNEKGERVFYKLPPR